MDLLPQPDTMEQARKRSAIIHLEQLNCSKLPTQAPLNQPNGDINGLYYGLLEKWTKDNIVAIRIAVKNRAFGNGASAICWENAFLAFMESMAMYLRDYSLLLEAVKSYREAIAGGKTDAFKLQKALDLYDKSSEEINKLAALWNMKFDPICDLTIEHPENEPLWDGPYCGAFYSNDASAPFIGLGFKGTDPFNIADLLVDWNYQQIQATAGNLFGTSVSQGVYTGLFDRFHFLKMTAWEYILQNTASLALNIPNSPQKHVMLHATGHSLGGSYASFAYAQALSLATPTPPRLPRLILLGDCYTFGSPRVGAENWAIAVKKAVALNPTRGQSWRIVNNGDLVPDVPPTTLKACPPYFYHINIGYDIFPDQAPIKIKSEIGREPPPPFPLPKNLEETKLVLQKITKHLPNAYYASMQEALNTSATLTN